MKIIKGEYQVIETRVTADGVRQARIDDEVYEIPHDHEIAPNATFPAACREAFWVDPLYMSVGCSDVLFASAKVTLAAIHDLTAIRDRMVDEARPLLDQAIDILRTRVRDAVPEKVIQSIDEQLTRIAVRTVFSAGDH
jgi:hypothetical protein